ncbi:MAG: dephospho-CoA kinase [Gammaproteobacteria bacterium]
MLVIGLTGGIGSGKSTVADMFARYHVPIIDADVIAREVIEPGQPALLDIIDHFETPLLQDDGSINRDKLRDIIFTHPEERMWLENLLHPLIRAEMSKQIAALTHPYCIVVIPLLLEARDPYPFIHRILIVDTTEELQLERAAKRDNKSTESIQAILNSQIKRADRLAKAHDVILNDGKLEDLEQEVSILHKKYLELSK